MDLPNTFECILYDLIFAKLAVNEIERERLSLIFSYLDGQKQCARTSNIYNDCNGNTSRVPQGSTLGASSWDTRGIFFSASQLIVNLSFSRHTSFINLLMIKPYLFGETNLLRQESRKKIMPLICSQNVK